jgi:O-antigen biosynthesis protein WbqP
VTFPQAALQRLTGARLETSSGIVKENNVQCSRRTRNSRALSEAARFETRKPGARQMKRATDLLIALLLLLPASLAIAVCVALIRLQSPGPGIFRQQRIGRDGAVFTCLKLRTMYKGTENAPSHETPQSAVTPLGAVLRHYKLDELPQIWNVLTGDMSFVGPRPSLTTQTELIEARRRRGVLALRPGITGPAQMLGIDMSEPERLAEEDAKYISSSGVIGDLRLMLATALGAGRGDRTSDAA